MSNNGARQQMDATQLNAMARQAVVRQSVLRRQVIFSQTINPATQPRVDIPPLFAGFIIGFIVNVRTNVAVAADTGTALTKTPFGPANLISRIQFQDIANNTRHDSTGWHFALVNSVRGIRPYLLSSAFAPAPASPIDYGVADPSLLNAAATIAQNDNSDVAMTYYVPVAYSDKDLTGGMFAAVRNATSRLTLLLNQQTIQARTLTAGSDAVYVTANDSTPPADVTVQPFTIEVLQVYYDNLPMTDVSYVLPALDMATYYEIKDTSVSGLVVNRDFPIGYSNFRDFLATIAVYRNRVAVTGVGPFALPTDIAAWRLQTANLTTIYDTPPRYVTAMARQAIGADLPGGVYYFNNREKPISTETYGNTNLVINASNVGTGAAVLVGYESFFAAGAAGLAAGLAPAG